MAWHEATWVDDPDAPKKKNRRSYWNFLWLLVVPAALIAFFIARSNNYWQWTDMTVTTLECRESVAEGATWAAMEAAGCTPAATDAEVIILDVGNPVDKEPTVEGATWTFKKVPSAFSTLGINVLVPESRGSVTVMDAETDPPSTLTTMNSDVSGLTFSSTLPQGDSTSFYVVIAP